MAGFVARSILVVAVIYALFSFSGCGIPYYYPTTQNVGLLKERGDIHASATIDAIGRGAAVGYAFTDNLGLIGNVRFFNRNNQGAKPTYDAYLWEPELVYIRRWTRPMEQEANLFWALHLAYGHGELARDQDYFKLELNRLSLLPALGFSGEYFDVAISSRFTVANHNFTQLQEFDIDPDRTARDYYGLYDVGNQAFGFIEPAFTIGGGYKGVKIRWQTVLVGQIGSGYISYINLGSYLSANFTINSRELRRKQK